MMEDCDVHQCYEVSNLSFYKTDHLVDYYVEFSSVRGYLNACELAKRENRKIVVLGKGSNLLFKNKQVVTVLAKSKMPHEFEKIDEDGGYWISSGVLLMKVLRECLRENLDSFYYLSSVPATIGGALAMNAGRGRQSGKSIYDFVEKVYYCDPIRGIEVIKATKDEVVKGYRETIFSGVNDLLILGAEFRFPRKKIVGNPIKDRIEWSKINQDHSGPNCGTVFKECRGRLMPYLKGFGFGGVVMSKKCPNWIINRSKDSRRILGLIHCVQLFSALLGKRAVLENVIIE
jgi:UDP-N-acetylmuramate dehydrogenase